MTSDHTTHWSKVVWCRYSAPKHRFIFQLLIRHKLLTKDKLKQMGIIEETGCCLCIQEEESQAHLFFHYQTSQRCVSTIKQWLGIPTQAVGIQQLVTWIQRNCKHNNYRRKVYVVGIDATIYYIWKMRNEKIRQHSNIDTTNTVQQIKSAIKARIHKIPCKKLNCKDRNWLDHL